MNLLAGGFGLRTFSGLLSGILQSRALRYTAVVFASYSILIYLVIAFFRIQYPFELEWLEGSAVDHVLRVLSGEKLYAKPTLHFIALFYTPLYFYVSAALSEIMGVGFTTLRLLSFASSLCCFLLIFLFIYRETKSRLCAFLGSCLFAATFQASGAWFDLARVDSLFLALLLSAIYFLRFRISWKACIFAGVLASLAFLTKQTTLIILLPVAVYLLICDRKRGVIFVLTTCLLIGGSTLFLNYLHSGWYSYYVFYIPSQLPIVKGMILGFWSKDIFANLPLAACISIYYLFAQVRCSKRSNFLFYLFLFAGMIGGAWGSRLSDGGFLNCLFPGYAVIAILFGLGIGSVLDIMKNQPGEKQKLGAGFVYIVCIMQFAILLYNPLKQVPTQKDVEAGNWFVDKVAKLEGDVIIPAHGYLAVMAGKVSYVHLNPLGCLRVCNDNKSVEVIEDIKSRIRGKKFSAIILDRQVWFNKEIEKYYTEYGPIFKDEHVFWTRTGMRTRPTVIFLPK